MYPLKAHEKIASHAPTQMWDLIYYVDDIAKEVPMRNKPRAIAAQHKRLLESTTHKRGRFVLRKTGTHKY